MNKNTLIHILDVLGAVNLNGEFRAKCPVCQSGRTAPEKFCMVVSPGTSKLVVLYCFKCCIPKNKEHNRAWVEEVNRRLTLPPEIKTTLDSTYINKLWGEVSFVVQQHTERADTNLIDRVYNSILNKLELRNEHGRWLRRRGFEEETAIRLGYRSTPLRVDEGTGGESDECTNLLRELQEEFTSNELLRVPGFTQSYGNGIKLLLRELAILIPCRDVQGRVVALKQRLLDKKGSRMRLLSSSVSGGPVAVNRVHVPLGVGKVNWNCLWVTEGERKADVWWNGTGIPVVGIPGINSYRLLYSTLKELVTKETKLVIALDKDNKEATQKVEKSLVEELLSEGYADIELAEWKEGKGLDDAFVAKSKVTSVRINKDKYKGVNPQQTISYRLVNRKSLRNEEIVPYLKEVGPKVLSEIPAYLPEIVKLVNKGILKKIQYTKKGPVLSI
jgi:hypothetical protein